MIFKDLERCFKRAFIHSCNGKKIFFTLPFLFLCGVIIVFCRSLAYISNKWIMLSLIFLPIFFSIAILYMLGAFLIRIYYNEVKSLKVSYTEVIKKSFKTALETLNISIPPALIFFLLWIIFGFFVALKEIPHIGRFIGVMISIIPFLIILCTILLCFFSLLSLFFVVPAMTLKRKKKLELVREVVKNLRKNVIVNITFFFSCMFFVLLGSLILIITAILTKMSFSIPVDSLYIGLQWFFMMIPFILFLTPLVIFFFNVASETYNLLQTKDR